MRWKPLFEPRLDEPLPLWMIYPVIFAALYVSHFTLLRLPYYWDEAGYYIPAAWDFFRTGSLIPDHYPAGTGDTNRRVADTYSIAYMRALLRRANEEVSHFR